MIRRTLALAGLIGVFACANAVATPVTVDLRVEGATQTLFEGPVTTDGHQIDKGDGPHPCDGTTASPPPPGPGPTMTSALDDSGLDWDGTWFSFGDFSIDRIGPDATDNNGGRYWGYALNYTPSQVGGCQQQVAAGDQVLFGYDFFNKQHLLRLSGPSRAAAGEQFTVTVIDGDGGEAMAGASVGGASTGAGGTASISIDTPGIHRLKAERADSLRSNALVVCVYAPNSGDCGSGSAAPNEPGAPAPGAPAGPGADTVAPRAFLSGLRDGRTYRRAPRILRGRVEEDRGIHQVYLRLRMIDRGGCRWLSGRREVFSRPRTCDRARFIRLGDSADWSYLLPLRLPEGARYIVDVKVLDRALNRDLEQVRFRVAG